MPKASLGWCSTQVAWCSVTCAAAAALVGSATPVLGQSRGSLGAAGVGQLGRGYPSGSLGSIAYNPFIRFSVGADAFLNQRRRINSGGLLSHMRGSLTRAGGLEFGAGGRPGNSILSRPGALRLEQQPLGRTPIASGAARSRAGQRAGFLARPPGPSPFRRRADSQRSRSRSGSVNPYGANPTAQGGLSFGSAPSSFAAQGDGYLFPAPHPEAGPLPRRPSWFARSPVSVGHASAESALPEPPPARTNVEAYLTASRRARHDIYVRQGWESFREKEYPRAFARFRLAETVDVADTEARRGAVYAALATEQYTLAGTMLGTLLRDDPSLFAHKDQIRSRYASSDDYREQRRRLRAMAERPEASIAARALYAFFLWQDADPGTADYIHTIGIARALAEERPTGVYALMPKRMQEGATAKTQGTPLVPEP